jgi:hypothetical protein
LIKNQTQKRKETTLLKIFVLYYSVYGLVEPMFAAIIFGVPARFGSEVDRGTLT